MEISNKKGNAVVIGVIIIAIIIGGVVWQNRSHGPIGDAMISDEADQHMMATSTGEIMSTTTMMTHGGYDSYAPEKLAFANTGKVILFFHAPWCPYCRNTDTNLNKDLSKIPSNVLILKTDYDSMVALKQKYGVTYQHTFVQVDDKGNLLTKWSGTETLPEILAKLK